MSAKSGNITVLKVGGNELDRPEFLTDLANAVTKLQTAGYWSVIVHGGGREIATWQKRLGLSPRFIEGLRVTDEESLAVAEMVLSGRMNKRLVVTLVNHGVPAVGLSGVDSGLIRVRRMQHPAGDLGWVGEIVSVAPAPVHTLLLAGIVPVVSPISLGDDGHTYNVNADHAAQALAVALHASRLVFISNVPGVLVSGRPVHTLTVSQAGAWIAEGIITGGMIPKVRSAIAAVEAGVSQAVITNLDGLLQNSGTIVLRENSRIRTAYYATTARATGNQQRVT
ncbi:MAG TPA: acetylglutamate kinase, partial [Anaerolineae bacterium]|nr:acetylglutamate kinase [Anaerolineae bacterium]